MTLPYAWVTVHGNLKRKKKSNYLLSQPVCWDQLTYLPTKIPQCSRWSPIFKLEQMQLLYFKNEILDCFCGKKLAAPIWKCNFLWAGSETRLDMFTKLQTEIAFAGWQLTTQAKLSWQWMLQNEILDYSNNDQSTTN